MRIALVVPGGVDRSGENRIIPALLSLIRRLAVGNDLHVIALNQEGLAGEWQLAGARVHNIGSRGTRLNAVRTLRVLHRQAPFEVIQSIWSGSCGLVAVAAGRLLGVPSPVHIAGGELIALPEIGYGGRLNRRGRLREAFTLRGATTLTAASVPIIESVAALGYTAHRIPMGVDLDTWPPRAPRKREPGKPARLIHVASLNAVKDQTTLLRALAQLADCNLEFQMDVVGEDTLHGKIQALVAQLHLESRVQFHGLLTQAQMRPLMESANLMVHTSRHEAGPLAVLEAAVAGVPTVGTAVGHIAEWTPAAALSVPVGDSPGLANLIKRVLEDEDLRMALAREAGLRATAADADYTARCFRELYMKLTGAAVSASRE